MMSNPEAKSSFVPAALLVLGALAIFCLGGTTAALLLTYRQGATVKYQRETATAESTIPAGVSLISWSENGQSGQYVMQIIEGIAPPVGVRVFGFVASDTDCDADAQGLSHCHNIIALANGNNITANNTHTMSRNPCLQPGEPVSITRLHDSWVVAVTRETKQTE